jgi:hypothetical protein
MANKEKSIIDEAVLDAKRIQETLNANTKEILRSIAKEEIDDIVKESLNEFEEEDVEAEVPEIPVDADAEEIPADVDMDSGEEVEDIEGDGSAEMGSSEEGDLEGDELGMDDEISSYGDEMDMTTSSDDEVIAVYKKLTGDDEIQIVSNDNGDIELTVNEPGEFVIKTDGAGDLGGEEDVAEIPVDVDVEEIPLDVDAEVDAEEIPVDVDAEEIPLDVDAEEIPVDDEEEAYEGYDENESKVVYEIAIDEMEDIGSVSAPEDKKTSGDNLDGGFDDDGQSGSGYKADTIMEDENVEEGEEVTEGETEVNETDEISEEDVAEGDTIEEKIGVGIGQSVGTHRNQSGPGSIGAPENPSSTNEYVSKADYDKLLGEAKAIKVKATEMAGTLQEQRKMLGKVVVFNTNLTNVTRLFTEHSTTKDEKRTIIERFDDEVSSIQESKKLFKAIEKELGNKTPISESVEEKISKEKSSSSSKLN